MSAEAETGATAYFATFAGRRRRFQLRLGEIEELERLCGAGIGEISLRLAGHRFRNSDVRETVRLGLEGGGLGEAEASALVGRYVDGRPLTDSIGIAAKVIEAAVAGIPDDDPGKHEAERSADQETSPPSSEPARPSDSPLETSGT